ncbi:Nitrate/nitrite sensor protein narX [Morganella morganii]|nr:Nitrate/nitrite sensor protein narX [Morganella morganii]
MLKHTSILTQITGFMVLLTVFAVIGMGLTNQITESVQGNAHAINKSGTLRMQSYRFLSEIPLTAHSQQYLDDFESDLTLLAGMKAVSPAKNTAAVSLCGTDLAAKAASGTGSGKTAGRGPSAGGRVCQSD